MEVKAKIAAKARTGKAFKTADGTWYNVEDKVVPYLAKINKGEGVVITFEKKGIKRTVSKVVKTTGGTSAPAKSDKPTCEDCGTELKDNKYKKCYKCNQKAPKEKSKTTWTGKSSYDNPEKTAQIQRGNALNAAAYTASGTGFSDPEAATQFVLELAERFLNWLRAE